MGFVKVDQAEEDILGPEFSPIEEIHGESQSHPKTYTDTPTQSSSLTRVIHAHGEAPIRIR